MGSTSIIGLHYSPRIIEDNHRLLIQRAGQGKETIIIASSPHGAALNFLKRVREETDHVDGNVKKIVSLIREINKPPAKRPVRLLHHNEVLRYSFVLTDEQVWIKLYRNSRGLSNVPAFAVTAGTSLFDFFKADIERLIESAANGTN